MTTLDWKNLGFEYLPTHGYVQVDYADGAWGAMALKTDPYISMHIAANCLHYGQAIFEGLKAFRQQDGTIAVFRPAMNAQRFMQSADRLCMEAPSEALFLAAVQQAVAANHDFVPPYGTGASLYIRPVLFATEPMVGINISQAYTFIVLVTPVGPYYKHGFRPVEAVVIDEYDRAAPCGTGRAKTAGNYAASLKPAALAKKMGYPIVLFTDPREHKYVDEFGTSNFIGITKEHAFKTAHSPSILESITNDSLQVLATAMGLTVVKEPIALDALDQFDEIGACGTAAVVTPIHAINRPSLQQRLSFGSPDEAGPVLTALYRQLQGIQYGEIEDTHDWLARIACATSQV